MFTTEQFLDSVKQEVAIIKHLYTKVPKDKLGYRPTPGQRSLQELLNFLPCNLALTKHVVSGDWVTVQQTMQDTQARAAKDFNAALHREMASFVEIVKAIPAADFQNKVVALPTGVTTALGDALLGLPFKFLVGYKMQLFLYLKTCGQTELNTLNCWFGIDGQTGRSANAKR